MLKILRYCPSCELGLPIDFAENESACSCGESVRVEPTAGLLSGEEVDRCAVCGYDHLHRRKNFPRRLGIAIVTVAAVATFWVPPRFFFMPLVTASIIDALLYFVVPWKVVCYVCHTEYRGIPPREDQAPYDLEKATEYQRLRWPRREPSPEA